MARDRCLAWLGVVGALTAGAPALAQPAPPTVRLGDGAGPGDPELLPEVAVVSRRLDEARRAIQPSLGATVTEFNRPRIEALPQGDNASLQQLLLQAPGVVQDSFGNVFVRGDHKNVQFRVNGVQLPEGLSRFGPALQTRFAYSAALITGALPAQYGFRTAGIVDIQTKTGANSPGGTVSLYGGSRGTIQPSFEYGGRAGPVDYYATGEYLRSDIGIENPTSSFNARNDTSNQARGFAIANAIIDPNTRISLLAGTSYNDFQIPTRRGQAPELGLSVNGVSEFDSDRIRQRQREASQFGILSLQKNTEAVDLQLSLFGRYSSLRFSPDPVADLLYNGIAQNARRQTTSSGVQLDASWRVHERHTVRAGFLGTIERTFDRTTSDVLPVGEDGAPTSDQPLSLLNKSARTGAQYGLYVQDEWRVLPSVTVNAGVRFDVVDQYVHENQVSPRVNVVWRPTSTTTIQAGYARYFAPPPFELVGTPAISRLVGTSAQPEILRNDTPRSERAHYFDIGIQQVVVPGLTVGVDAYYKRSRNLIDEGQFGSPIILTAFNFRRGDVVGIEGSTSYDRGPLSLYGNVTYSRAIARRINSAQFNFAQEDLDYIENRFIKQDHDQRWTGSAGAAYTVGAEGRNPLRLSGTLLVGSGLRSAGSEVPNGRAIEGYYTINLSAVQRLDLGIGRGTEVRLDVINLLDRKYQLRDGTGIGVGAPQFGLRRAILGGLAQWF